MLHLESSRNRRPMMQLHSIAGALKLAETQGFFSDESKSHPIAAQHRTDHLSEAGRERRVLLKPVLLPALAHPGQLGSPPARPPDRPTNRHTGEHLPVLAGFWCETRASTCLRPLSAMSLVLVRRIRVMAAVSAH